MVDSVLLETLELLTPSEQKAILAFAEFLKNNRGNHSDSGELAEALRSESPVAAPPFATPDEGLSPARLAARRFMRENPTLMRLLAK